MKYFHIALGCIAILAAVTIAVDWYQGVNPGWATRLLAISGCLALFENAIGRAFPSLRLND